MTDNATSCPACLNGCGGARSDCPLAGAAPATRPTGRPSSYSDATAARIRPVHLTPKQRIAYLRKAGQHATADAIARANGIQEREEDAA